MGNISPRRNHKVTAEEWHREKAQRQELPKAAATVGRLLAWTVGTIGLFCLGLLLLAHSGKPL